jgi:hypothetical protein
VRRHPDAPVRDGQHPAAVVAVRGPHGDRRVRRGEPQRVLDQFGQQVGDVGGGAAGHPGPLADLDPHPVRVLRAGGHRLRDLAQRDRVARRSRRLLPGQHQQVLRGAAGPGGQVVEPGQLGQPVRVVLGAAQPVQHLPLPVGGALRPAGQADQQVGHDRHPARPGPGEAGGRLAVTGPRHQRDRRADRGDRDGVHRHPGPRRRRGGRTQRQRDARRQCADHVQYHGHQPGDQQRGPPAVQRDQRQDQDQVRGRLTQTGQPDERGRGPGRPHGDGERGGRAPARDGVAAQPEGTDPEGDDRHHHRDDEGARRAAEGDAERHQPEHVHRQHAEEQAVAGAPLRRFGSRAASPRIEHGLPHGCAPSLPGDHHGVSRSDEYLEP